MNAFIHDPIYFVLSFLFRYARARFKHYFEKKEEYFGM